MAKIIKEEVSIKPINVQKSEITIIGDSPLIVHAWSERVKKGMLDKQMKKAASAKEAKDPERDYEECFYKTADGKHGFPAMGFKSAAVKAAGRFADGMKMTEVRGAFHVDVEMVEISGTPSMREDMVRVGMGTADIRYRPEFKKWQATLPIRYNADAISLEQIVNIINLAGFHVGVGEWRPERNGRYGLFHVALEGEIKKVKK
jgi:hypothetical protein